LKKLKKKQAAGEEKMIEKAELMAELTLLMTFPICLIV
jgi:hypothetical protein